MKKNKKIIISVIVVLIITIICIATFFIVKNTKNSNQSEKSESRLSKVYEKMNEKSTYTFATTLNNDNKKIIKRKNDKARIDLSLEGEDTSDIVRDGDTYLIIEADKTFYKYQNNDIELTAALLSIKEISESQKPQKTKEEINGKKYYCEEYKGISSFLLQPTNETIEEENASTKFYFKGNNLEYIKTKIKDKEEVLKVDIAYDDIADNEFEIPSEYEEK